MENFIVIEITSIVLETQVLRLSTFWSVIKKQKHRFFKTVLDMCGWVFIEKW